MRQKQGAADLLVFLFQLLKLDLVAFNLGLNHCQPLGEHFFFHSFSWTLIFLASGTKIRKQIKKKV
jgi:hypothetical protein